MAADNLKKKHWSGSGQLRGGHWGIWFFITRSAVMKNQMPQCPPRNWPEPDQCFFLRLSAAMRVDFAHHSKKQRDHNANDIRQLVNAGASRSGVRPHPKNRL